MMKRRILHQIKIDDISAVDRPCQEHARMVIMKRADIDPDDDIDDLDEMQEQDLQQEQPLDFNQAVSTIRKRDNCSGSQAMQRARAEYPEAFEDFTSSPLQKSNSDFDKLVAEEIRKGAPAEVAGQRVILKYGVRPDASLIMKNESAAGDFMDCVRSITKRDGVSRTQALAIARREHPDAFATYQES